MRHILIAAFALVPVTAISGSAHAAYSGRLLNVTASGTIFRYPITQGPTETLTFTTSDLSPGSDTVVHVQSADDGVFGYIAGDDDYLFDSLASQAVVPATGGYRHLIVFVRAYGGASQGTCTMTVTSSTWGSWTESVVFGGAKYILNQPLQLGAHVMTVERQAGSTDTVLLLTTGDSEHAVAYDDDNGTWTMSFIHAPEAGVQQVIIANRVDPGALSVDFVWDDDADTTDYDNDRLGETLEQQLLLNPHDDDSDDDGLPDGMEVLGANRARAPSLKLPTWGANPAVKDMFMEIDWVACTAPSCATVDDNQIGDTTIANTNAFAAQVNSDFSPVSVHLDIGRNNTDPATMTQWGSWGGAARGSWSTGDGCDGDSFERRTYFHHGVSTNTVPGHSYTVPGSCFVTPDAARVLVHEVGHNLGILHGGRPNKFAINYKPHYLSLMNYVYQNNLSVKFSDGSQASLNPKALSEFTGLGSSAPDKILAKLQSVWCPLGGPLNGKCVGRAGNTDGIPVGAVDWNRDGVIDPQGTTTRAAVPIWDYPARLSGTWLGNVLQQPSMTWVAVGGAVGNQLWIVGRNPADNFLQYARVGTSSIANCAANFQNYNDGGIGDLPGPFDCAGLLANPVANLPGNKTSNVAPAIAELGNKLLVIRAASSTLRSNIVTINPQTGAVSTGADVTLPGSVVANMDLTALSLGSGTVQVWTRSSCSPSPSCIRLMQWTYQNNTWFGPTDQLWMDGTPIQPIHGVAVTRGYQNGSSDPFLYAALPTVPDGKVEFVRQEKYGPNAGRWAKVPDAWTILGSQPNVNGRPGLAFVPNPAPNSGRFHISLPITGCSGGTYGNPDGAGKCLALMFMTEGNMASGNTKRLKWTTTGQALAAADIGKDSKTTNLMFTSGRDSNLRALVQQNDGTTLFFPLADGVVDASIGDLDDRQYLNGALRASLSLDCPSPGCSWPNGKLPQNLF